MERSRCLVALALGLFVLSCRKPDYFPLKDNQEWRFADVSVASLTEKGEQESLAYAIKVTGSAVQPRLGKVYEVRVTRNGEPYMAFFFRKTTDAVFVLPASHLDGLGPTPGWVKLLELPLREDAFWYGDAEHSVSFEVMAREDIGVPAGRLRNCFRVRIHAPVPYRFILWLAPDAGIVRWTRTFSRTRSEVCERIRR